jgi:asparagine synthase (glutamine-hydrolysing)
MTGAMAHGGPDDEGLHTSGNVTLGHRRLSIIDLSTAGHQPMIHPAGHTVVTYNGEIYNYKELKQELTDQGQHFNTQTDTEVIINAYKQSGTASFGKLSGMFAFALLDTGKRTLYLVRDRSGIKPLYYHIDSERLVFASEVKAFRMANNAWPEDTSWRMLFLTFGFLPHPHSTLSGVHSLSPGNFLEVDIVTLKGKETPFTSNGPRLSLSEVNETIRQATTAAVKRHLISDAPLGVFLSGGIDSSLLTLLAGREAGEHLRTVSVNFADSTLDEGKYQREVLARTSHHNHQSFVVTEEMFWDAWVDIFRHMDQPSIDGVNTYFVSQAAHKSGLKAVLSGLGADELFGGYDSFRRVSWIRSIRTLPAKQLIAKLMGTRKDAFGRIAFLDIPGAIGDYLFLRGIHTPAKVARILDCDEKDVWQQLKSLTLPVPDGLDELGYASFLETNMYMRNQLLKDTDYMSMRYGLEVRVPFLDQDLVQTVKAIGLKGHYRPSHPKYMLTHAFADLLPAAVIHRKKQGFVFPFHQWLANGIRGGRSQVGKLRNGLDVGDFLAGKTHWSKCWSGIVLDQFRV